MESQSRSVGWAPNDLRGDWVDYAAPRVVSVSNRSRLCDYQNSFSLRHNVTNSPCTVAEQRHGDYIRLSTSRYMARALRVMIRRSVDGTPVPTTRPANTVPVPR